jgi:protein Tex
VKVKVLEVDLARKRISLTMKLDAKPAPKGEGGNNQFRQSGRNERVSSGAMRQQAQPQGQSAMAAAFAKLQTKR